MLPFLFLVGVVTAQSTSVTNGLITDVTGSITCTNLVFYTLLQKPSLPYSSITIGPDRSVTLDYGLPQIDASVHVTFLQYLG